MSGKKIDPKFISDDMTTDEELLSEVQNRQNADVAMQQQLDNHSDQHLPGGSDALPTAVPVNTGIANSEGTSTSFARADHVHDTIIVNDSFKSNSSIRTTATVEIPLISITPNSGNYMVSVNLVSFHNTYGGSATFSIYVGGVKLSDTEIVLTRDSQNIPLCYSVVLPINVNGSQDIEVMWKTDVGEINNVMRNITLTRLG